MNRSDRGSATLELVTLTPALLLIVLVVIMAGRLAMAHQAVEAVAETAARTASIARTASAARSSATAAAADSLANQRLNCTSSTVNVDTSGFAKPVGTPATITATISCTVNLADLSLPGVPGSWDVTATASSPLDTYRERS